MKLDYITGINANVFFVSVGIVSVDANLKK